MPGLVREHGKGDRLFGFGRQAQVVGGEDMRRQERFAQHPHQRRVQRARRR